MKAIIIANGNPPTKELIITEMTNNTKIIAADGGANCLWRYKIFPDYLIGDLDSINKNALTAFKKGSTIIESYPKDKDLTDAQLALKKAQDLKIKELVFLGCTAGKRVDHLLGALGLLLTSAKLKINACLKDESQTIHLLTKTTTIHQTATNKVFSLLAYDGPVRNLTIKGAKYPLQNYLLKVGNSLTLSNEFAQQKVTIRFSTGRLLLIINRNHL
jgi:thiamine pyrophosphokinase